MKKLSAILGCSVLILIAAWPGARAAEDVRLDYLDIGTDTVVFNEHDGVGWGPVEPASHGGSWGGIAADPESPDGACRAVWYYNPEEPDYANAMLTLFPHPGSSRRIVMRALAGIADDSFKVSVLGKHGDWVQVYTYSDLTSDETWIIHDIQVPVNQIKAGRPLTVKIEATATALPLWWGFETYGQLAVDWIELWGNGSQ